MINARRETDRSSDATKGWSRPVAYPAGTELFQQGTPSRRVYFVERGMVKLSVMLPEGQEMIVALRRRHSLVAAPAVILGRPYSFTATTVTKCSLRSMQAKMFVRLLRKDIRFSWQINRILSAEIAAKLHQTVSMGCLPARDRLKEILSELITESDGREAGKPFLLTLPITHLDLARIIAVTPEHLCRMLRDMEKEGIIWRDKKMLAINRSPGFAQANPL